ncbi:MAG: ABC transporter permease [Gemmatimonadetes bacterium]|nr:ABC transporter permease [Gemmatimonadota bacterium]
MTSVVYQLGVNLRLHFRNKMGLLYSYLFPAIFLVAFWVLYRTEEVPLARHMGELLTVTALGGACFGLPTSMVAERERGVWRRYRLAPVHIGSLVASTVVARYFLLLTAGVVQLALALAIGMPFPEHPLDLFVAFTFVCFAFLGLGLVIATLADNIPAVQALGQCIFLPMLIIGGVAVRLASLPEWAQHVSAFFPGRYAVDALQATVTGNGLNATRFSLLALLLIGAAGSLAGAKMFRWDAQQRFARSRGKGWLGVALVAWVAVGLLAESNGIISIVNPRTAEDQGSTDDIVAGLMRQGPARPAEPTAAPGDSTPATPGPAVPADTGAVGAQTPVATPGAPTIPTAPPAVPLPGAPAQPAAAAPATGWQAATLADIERDIDFSRVPSDQGVVSPIAPSDDVPQADLADQLQCIRTNIVVWGPGRTPDPIQRVRNYLYVAAVPDVFQIDLERYVPAVVMERLVQVTPRDELIKILYWIAMHPEGGDLNALDEVRTVCLDGAPGDTEEVRNRTAIYAVKFLGRLTGKLGR